MRKPPAGPRSVLVVDDETPARQRLLDLLRRDGSVVATSEATTGLEAVEAIGRLAPDLVFLDVQMPEMDGIRVVAAVGADAMPLTVFVTAFDRHALEAFDANALDYLLKPFSDERFEATMARVRARLAEREACAVGDRLAQLIASAQPGSYLSRLAVRTRDGTRLVPADDIEWIEAAGVYVTLHAGGRDLLHRASLSELEARLDPRRFVRVHRSAIVNLDRVVRLEPLTHGEFEVVTARGARIRLSRTYRPQFEARLGQSL